VKLVNVAKLDRAVDELNGELNRRQAGEEPDPRFDLAIDVLLDLADAVDAKPEDTKP
jgi:hypothetical protein